MNQREKKGNENTTISFHMLLNTWICILNNIKF